MPRALYPACTINRVARIVSSQCQEPCIQPVQSTRLQGSCPVNARSLVSSMYNQHGCKNRVRSMPRALYPACTINKVARIVSSQRHKPCIQPVQSTRLQGSCLVNATSLVSSLYNQQGCKVRVHSMPRALYPACTINKFARIVSSQCQEPCIQPVQSTSLQGSCPANAKSLVSSMYNQQGCNDRVQSMPRALYPACTINTVARIVSSQCHKPCIQPVQSTRLQGSCPFNAKSLVSSLYNQQGC